MTVLDFKFLGASPVELLVVKISGSCLVTTPIVSLALNRVFSVVFFILVQWKVSVSRFEVLIYRFVAILVFY